MLGLPDDTGRTMMLIGPGVLIATVSLIVMVVMTMAMMTQMLVNAVRSTTGTCY